MADVYLTALKDEAYRDGVFAYVEEEDTPRPLAHQLDLLTRAGFRDPEVLHKHLCFAAFGAVKLCPPRPGQVRPVRPHSTSEPNMTDAFAVDWIAAWNHRDIDNILSHYADAVVFASPFAVRLTGDGTVRGREALRAYFAAALASFTDLHFRLRHALAGVTSLVLVYDSVEGLLAAEAFEFDAGGKVCRVNCHYTSAKPEGRP